MKTWVRLIHKTCLIPVIVLTAMLFFLLPKGAESAYTIYFESAEMTEAADGGVEMIASGANMLRVNSFYVDGKRIDECRVEKMTYGKCRVIFDESVFSRGSTWYELRLGYSKWGFINLLSSPVWVEWTGS